MRAAIQVLMVITVTAVWDRAALAKPIEISSVLVKLIEQVDVPARDAGALAEVAVQEGQTVSQGELLARQEDDEARLTVEQTKLELDIATKQAEDDVELRAAEATVRVAQSDLRRSRQSIEKLPNSISQSELEHLELAELQSQLKVERIRRDLQIASLTRRLRETEYQIATSKWKRHEINAPIKGMVVEVLRRPGEWLEPGDKVARIVRIDRLRVEGFVNIAAVSGELANAPVELHVTLPGSPERAYAGKIVFVSPEVDPVTGQFRVWAEIDNSDLQLRPGLRGRMTIRQGP